MPQVPASLMAAGSMQIGVPVSTGPYIPVTSSTTQLFLNTGPVLITGLVSTVVTVFDSAATLFLYWIVATAGTNLCAASATLASATVGTTIYITGVLATAAQIVVAAGPPVSVATMGHSHMINQIIWPGGTANVGTPLGFTATTGQTTGQLVTTLFYVPLAPGAGVKSLV